MPKAGAYNSPRWSGEIADCSMPMTFDTYSNCGYKCLYCFSQYQRALGKCKAGYLKNEVKQVNVEKVKRIFLEPDSSQVGPYIKQEKVFQWGGLSDPFCTIEQKRGVTLELLRFFREIDYPICFSTKGVWWLDDPRYTELFRDNPKWNMKFSIITLDERKAARMEPVVPSPHARLDAIHKFAALNSGGATLRLRPFIVGLSNPKHGELVTLAGEAGATAVSIEFFCLETRSNSLKKKLPVFDELCGMDVGAFYKRFSRGAGYLRLNRKVKKQFVDEMEAAARAVGMRFYVSDAHFKERCDNGSCCGLPESWNYSRGQWTEALMIARERKEVTWACISPGMDFLKGFLWGKAQGFNSNSVEKRASFQSHTMFDYMRWLWNNPKAGQSPYTLFGGVLVPTRKDNNGDLVYSLSKGGPPDDKK